MEDIINNADKKMQKSISSLEHSLAQIRTGRAHPGILSGVKVSYYGSETPLTQVANVVITDAQTLTVTPWEKNIAAEIDKSIRSSDLGLNPVMVGDSIRVPLPPLTEDRRKELVKNVKQEVEHAKIAIRNARRDANKEIKQLLEQKLISEDEQKKSESKIQVITDAATKKTDLMYTAKEQELMKI